MKTPIRILGIAGSLRRGSYNRAALRAATELAPKGATVETFELDGIPPFNQDEEQNPPAKVTELKRRIREANAILFVTPEYNWSVSGVLKNAIDWASRPHGDSSWNGKPAAIMGAFDGLAIPGKAAHRPVRNAPKTCQQLLLNNPNPKEKKHENTYGINLARSTRKHRSQDRVLA
jgi:chromate reductase